MGKHVIGTAGVFVVMYFIAAFIANDIDAGTWGLVGRGLYVFFSVIFSMFIVVVQEEL